MTKVEFLIVGNGLAGTMLAFEMFEKGIEFRIISSQVKRRSSVVAAGMFNPLVFKRLTKSWMADDLIPFAKAKYQKLENLLNGKFFFEKDILKSLTEQEKQLWIARLNTPEFNVYIHSVYEDSPAAYLSKGFAFGRVKGSGFLNLTRFFELADSFFQSKGLSMEYEFDASTFKPSTGRYNLSGVKPANIVFCEGAHVGSNPSFRFVKMVPCKGEVLHLHSFQLDEEYILHKNVFVLPVGNHIFKVGSTYEWNDLSEIPTEGGKNNIMERLTQLVSADYTLVNHVAGIRPTVADRRPVLGRHPQFKNIWIFSGLGTKGVMLAPYFAHEMLKTLTIANYSLCEKVQVERFL